MGAVKFYHLTGRSLAEAARPILSQALGQGWRVMLRGPDRTMLERLDMQLWEPRESFLPHGLEGGEHDRGQPVLLGSGAAVNGAKAVMLLAGSPVDPDEAAAMERVWLLFEGADERQMQAARAEWKAVVAAGLVAEYWSDASGRWEMKTATGGAAG
ncbi:DNA polymerase III subunit chi [Pseudogemmobacter bohemicus]|uniref:DNA polymerase III subunit chi n=1 Tax=Pseudogemmobacter bohemicus TaxID=2250708 RepID=UPI000DD36437|nr:DNA polymerase III subunit chi [Pseudogemmobacter bohemicus]